MSHSEFKPPRQTPSRRGHLERLTGDYGRAHGIAHERARRWLSLVSFAGVLDSVRADDEPRFLIKGGASMELRLGLGARTTKDIDVVFRGAPREMLDALEEAFAQPYGNFSFRRKGRCLPRPALSGAQPGVPETPTILANRRSLQVFAIGWLVCGTEHWE